MPQRNEMDTIKARIVSLSGGLYKVEGASGGFLCRAKGAFRYLNQSPLVGDEVVVEVNETGESTIKEILPRKSALIRPPLANLDYLFICIAVKEPDFSTLTADKLVTISDHNNIEPVIVITKKDLDLSAAKKLAEDYETCGYKSFCVSGKDGDGCDELKRFIIDSGDSISAFAGVSGAGKSTLINQLFPTVKRETGDLSRKIKRGKNTTRTCDLYSLKELLGEGEGYFADTPGFSNLDIEKFDFYTLDNLQFLFREFDSYLTTCKYTKCTHTKEEGCKIIEAVNEGKIPRFRHEDYKILFEDLKRKRRKTGK